MPAVFALVLISSYRIYGERFPHWVVVTGFDAHYIYVHDPLVDVEGRRNRHRFHQHADPAPRISTHGPLRQSRTKGRADPLLVPTAGPNRRPLHR
jgi:hypothetical protein